MYGVNTKWEVLRISARMGAQTGAGGRVLAAGFLAGYKKTYDPFAAPRLYRKCFGFR